MQTAPFKAIVATAILALLPVGTGGVGAAEQAADAPAPPAATPAAPETPAAAIPRPMTWRVTARPEALLVYRCGGTSPLVYVPAADTGDIRFLACPGDLATLTWKRTAPQAEGTADKEAAPQEAQLLLVIDAADGPELTLTVDDDWAFVRRDGKPVGLLAGPSANGSHLSDEALAVRLADLPSTQLQGMRWLGVGGAGDEGKGALQRAFVQRVAEAKPPRLTVFIGGEDAPLSSLAALDPVALLLDDGAPAGTLAALAGKRVATVIVANDDTTADLAGLAKLPGLRHLQLWEGGPDDAPLRLPEGLALESLGITSDAEAVVGLDKHKGLVRLAAPAEALASLDLRAAFPKLVSLATQVSKLPAVPSGLRHLAFIEDEDVTPELLARVVKANPDLSVIEFVGCNELPDLSALKPLARLGSVLIAQKGAPDTKSLAELKGTGFFALPAEEFEGEGSARLKELKSRRPDATVVPVQPLCLGSGWILLLLPAVAVGFLAAWLNRRRRCAARPGGACP
ncbi:MAG: hypothetical protein BWZ02_02364 [Lentisphaerae bacterium ADurb.BinA184]|nr:MAG: hypothetical protein BWZ02_02364 [Lentisphaerae bacterium ADurb.BinA184]